jgi:anti-anti-sigma factor
VGKEAAAAGPREHRPPDSVHAGKLDVTERQEAGVQVLDVSGELDINTAPALCLRLEAARRGASPRVLLDLSGLEFCDSTGLRALILAAQEIAASAGRFGAVVPPGNGAVARMFTVCGAAEFLRVFPSCRDGLAALERHR